MKILAVDTTSDVLSLAIIDERRVWKRRIAAKGRHEELLPRETDRLLKRARWKLRDIELVAAASGPGSFTGIRVGMTFASILAETLKRPAVAVSRFEAEAARAAERLPSPLMRDSFRISSKSLEGIWGIAVVLPSREDEIFYQFFRCVRGSIREHRPPEWVKFSDWPQALRRASRGKKVLLTGSAACGARALLGTMKASVKIQDDEAFGAEWLVAPALERLARGTIGDFAPLYLKPAYYERASKQKN